MGRRHSLPCLHGMLGKNLLTPTKTIASPRVTKKQDPISLNIFVDSEMDDDFRVIPFCRENLGSFLADIFRRQYNLNAITLRDVHHCINFLNGFITGLYSEVTADCHDKSHCRPECDCWADSI